MWRRLIRFDTREEAQSLLETAIAMPLVLTVAFNIINLTYFWFMILTLSAAPRMGVQYSAQGGQAIGISSAPNATQVSNLVYDNVTNSVHGATSSNTTVRVCTKTVGVTAGGVAQCQTFSPSAAFSFSSVAADPEAPQFVLNRVDVGYTVTPLIPGTVFGVLLPDTLNFKRQVSMRSLF